MSPSFRNAPSATRLNPDEALGLIPDYIATQEELNTAEQENILEAFQWMSSRPGRELLTDTAIRDLHRQMFRRVWKWAGEYRKSDKNLGCVWMDIPQEIKRLCDDVVYWMDQKTFAWDEIAARLHHRLVSIHPFVNGNGRHARMLTDFFLQQNNQPAFTWGDKAILQTNDPDEIRCQYLEALRQADQRQYDDLLKFVRS